MASQPVEIAFHDTPPGSAWEALLPNFATIDHMTILYVNVIVDVPIGQLIHVSLFGVGKKRKSESEYKWWRNRPSGFNGLSVANRSCSQREWDCLDLQDLRVHESKRSAMTPPERGRFRRRSLRLTTMTLLALAFTDSSIIADRPSTL